MMTDRLVLHEFGTALKLKGTGITALEISSVNARWRHLLGLRSDPFILSYQGRELLIRAEGVTGVIKVGNVRIEVVPKFLTPDDPDWRTILWRILSLVSGGKTDTVLTSASLSKNDDFADVLAELFINSYTSGAARGLPLRYADYTGMSATPRGSFDSARASQWFSRPWYIPFRDSELADATPLACLLRWAALRLSCLVTNRENSQRLSALSSELSHVSPIAPPLEIARSFSLGSQYRGLEGAKQIALLLLTSSGLRHADGLLQLPGFLWNSNVVYENLVFLCCDKAARNFGLKVGKRSYVFAQSNPGFFSNLHTEPDVVFTDRNGVVVAVADAKYKVTRAKPKSSDSYQMFAASHALGASNTALLYPSMSPKDGRSWFVNSKLYEGKTNISTIFMPFSGFANNRGLEVMGAPIFDWLEQLQ